jgi:hypothetical protein
VISSLFRKLRQVNCVHSVSCNNVSTRTLCSADCGHTICRKCVPICCSNILYKCSSCRTEYPLGDTTSETFGKVNYALRNIVEMAEKGLFDVGAPMQPPTTAHYTKHSDIKTREEPSKSGCLEATSGSYCPLFAAGTCTRGYSCSMLHIHPVGSPPHVTKASKPLSLSTPSAPAVAGPPVVLDSAFFTGAASHIADRSTAGPKQSTLSGYNWDDVIPDDSFLTFMSMRTDSNSVKDVITSPNSSNTHVATSSWTCSCCTLINEPHAKYCGVCSTPRDS